MKKKLSFVAVSALAVSAVAVTAPASTDAAVTTAQPGFYDTTTNTYYTVAQFQSLTQAQKKALVKDGVYLYDGTKVISAKDAVLSTNAQLPSKYIAAANFNAADLDAIYAASVTPPPPVTGELKVESVSAINAKQVQVTFNKALDETEAKKVTNYSITREGGAAEDAGSVTLSEDKKTVTLTLTTALTNYTTKNKVVVEKAVGLETDHTVTDLALSDTIIPTVSNVESTGPRTFVLTFSEPINQSVVNSVGKLVLDNGLVTLDASNSSWNADNTKLTVRTYTNLSVGEHKLKVIAGSSNNIVDFAGYQVIPVEKTFNVVADTTAPTATVKENTEKTVTVEFDKPVSNLVGNTNVTVSHTYKGSNAVNGSKITNPSGDNKTFVIAFDNALPPGTATVYFDYTTNTADTNKVKDNYGNIFAPTSFQVSTNADTVKPTVTEVKFEDATTVKVTFSEKVETTSATKETNYSIKTADATNATINVLDAQLDSTGKVVTLTTAQLNGGNYNLTVKDIKDISVAGNKMDDYSTSFAATDKVAPNVADLVAGGAINSLIIDTTARKVLIGFTEKMDKASIEDGGNYTLLGQTLPEGTTLTASADLKSVVIDFPDTTTLSAGATTIEVGKVKDFSGNAITALSTRTTVQTDTGAAPTKVEAIGKNQVRLTFEGTLTGIKASDFAIDVDGTSNAGKAFELAASVADVKMEDGKTIVTLNTASDIASGGWTNATNGPAVQSVAGATPTSQAAASTTKDGAGRAVNFVAVVATDKIGPSISKVNHDEDANTATVAAVKFEGTNDANNNGVVNKDDTATITLTFNEDLKAGSISNSTFSIEGYDIDLAEIDSGDASVVTLNLVANEDNASTTPVVKQVLDITDANGNKLAAGQEYTAYNLIAVDSQGDLTTALGVDFADIKLTNSFSVTAVIDILRPVSIDGNGKTITTNQAHTLVVNADKVSVKNTTFAGATANSIYVQDAANVEIVNNIFNAGGINIEADALTTATIASNKFQNMSVGIFIVEEDQSSGEVVYTTALTVAQALFTANDFIGLTEKGSGQWYTATDSTQLTSIAVAGANDGTDSVVIIKNGTVKVIEAGTTASATQPSF